MLELTDVRQGLVFVFFNDTATTEIYTLSLHDALPISDLPAAVPPGRLPHDGGADRARLRRQGRLVRSGQAERPRRRDRKSTRLNSSHANISYAVFCLQKNKLHRPQTRSASRRRDACRN